MLAGVGIEAFEQLGGRGFLEFDRGDKAEDLVPLVGQEFGLDVGIRENLVALLFIPFALLERIELTLREILDTRRKRKAQRMFTP